MFGFTSGSRSHTIIVVSTYGLGIVLICMVGGFVPSLVAGRLITDIGWRRVAFCAGIAAAEFYVGIQPTGYDQWDAYAAMWYGGGAVIGWIAGFGVVALAGRDGR
jgi:hypothetical protein